MATQLQPSARPGPLSACGEEQPQRFLSPPSRGSRDETTPRRFQVINCTGRLVADPNLKELPANSGSVCEIRIAVDGMGRGGRDQAGYIDVHSYGDSGKAAAKIITEGWLVAVNGRLQHEVYEKDGQKRSAYRVIGHIEFLAAPRTNDDAEPSEDWRADLPDKVPF